MLINKFLEGKSAERDLDSDSLAPARGDDTDMDATPPNGLTLKAGGVTVPPLGVGVGVGGGGGRRSSAALNRCEKSVATVLPACLPARLPLYACLPTCLSTLLPACLRAWDICDASSLTPGMRRLRAGSGRT